MDHFLKAKAMEHWTITIEALLDRGIMPMVILCDNRNETQPKDVIIARLQITTVEECDKWLFRAFKSSRYVTFV